MRIQEITSRNRRDFQAIYVCQHCDHTKKGYGYDDSYFHDSIIPKMECEKCGKDGGKYTPFATKYADNQIV